MKTKFSEVPMNKTFTYNGIQYRKDRQDKAQEVGTSSVRQRFSPNDQVEYDGPAVYINSTGRWQDDPMTERQRDYLVSLGVDIRDRKLTKGQASDVINAVKRGDGIGHFGFFYQDGSN
jgi:hypothetical protein